MRKRSIRMRSRKRRIRFRKNLTKQQKQKDGFRVRNSSIIKMTNIFFIAYI